MSQLQAMKAHGGRDARAHIYTATTLGRSKVDNSTLGRLYPRGKTPRDSFYRRLIGHQDVWTRRSEKRSPHLRHPGSNPGSPARSQAPCGFNKTIMKLPTLPYKSVQLSKSIQRSIYCPTACMISQREQI